MEEAMVNFSLNVRLDSGPPHIQYQLWTAYSSPSFHFFFRCLFSLFLFLLFFVARRPAIYTRASGEKREIYNNKAPGITGTSVPRRPVVGCNRWRHKPMSTRNLEFLTPSRWLATTRGSRHLIVPTATNVPLVSLVVSFSLSLSLSRAHTGLCPFSLSCASFFLFSSFAPSFWTWPHSGSTCMACTPKYHVVLQAAVRSDRSTRRISTQRGWQSVWPDRTVHTGVVERCTPRRLLWKSSMVSKKGARLSW